MNVAVLNTDAEAVGADFRYTAHAATRMQQRGIPPLIVEAALRHGTKLYAPGGVTRRVLDNKAIKRSQKHFGKACAKPLADYCGIYVVINSDGIILTVAHLH